MASLPYTSREPASPTGPRHKRRATTALSCAECRRLKLKCSRVFPCSNCVKKGCGPICPDGSLTTGKGNRFVLANTEVLHDKIGELATRVRQLEDGLSQSHAQHSLQPHPLLAPNLLNIKRPLERERLDAPPKQEKPDSSNEGVDAMGSLSISEGGRSKFFGQAANSWYLLQNETASGDENDAPDAEPAMPTDIPWIAYAFPFTANISKTGRDVRTNLINLLPRVAVAQRFCDIYYRHAAWMCVDPNRKFRSHNTSRYTPISEADFYENIFGPIYDSSGSSYESVSSHNLSVLYMILAIGTLVDLAMPAHSPEATEYYQLGRAALSIDSVLEEPSIAGIQSLLLMCHFMFWADIEGPRWVLMGLVVKLAHSIGLHRDSRRWNLDPDETHKRRCLLYEIYTYDSWQSLTFGRPPSFSLAHIDAKLPHESTTNMSGEVELSSWKHGWSAECLSVVHDQVFGARAPAYATVQELDKKVRAYYVPPSLQVPGFGGAKLAAEPEQPTVELTMQRYCSFAIKEITLFYMHRGFFAQALEDSPQDPMGSRYGPSVLAAYTSACTFVGLIESLFKQHPALTERLWFYFMHVFSCAIVLGSIAVKPRMALAPSALSHLDSACSLFERVSDRPRTAKILPILRKLKAHAHEALINPDSNYTDSATRSAPKVKTEVDELAALGGGTRLVTRRATSSPSTPSRSASDPASQPASPSPPVMVESPHAWQGFAHVQQDYNDFPQYSIGPGTAPTYDSPGLMQTAPEYYQYAPVGYPGVQDMAPVPDLNYSWQNFMSQFKG
ncbi:fungal-specific transcription factor domain-containing protein [Mycena vulgaris]|nr:fungal-specific transcription factor domain-containing protein [Mycena vulgaris]